MAKIIKSTTRKRMTPTYTPNLDSGIAAALVPNQNAVYIHDAYTESMSSSIYIVGSAIINIISSNKLVSDENMRNGSCCFIFASSCLIYFIFLDYI